MDKEMEGPKSLTSALPTDVIVLILEFLTLKERLQYETVDKEWARVFAQLWEKQTVLGFKWQNSTDPSNNESWCHVEHHKLRKEDCLRLRNQEMLPRFSDINPKLERLTLSVHLPRENVEKIVARFPELKSLNIMTCISNSRFLEDLESLEVFDCSVSGCGKDCHECRNKKEEELEEDFGRFLSSRGSTLKRLAIKTELPLRNCLEYITC